ncbi:MAG: SUF system Fe-S cluster assembly regulator [Planctomycetes bacterium]|nr:SUF system Fe-S cluster assembly regulator [Planctomycetota bacterium]
MLRITKQSDYGIVLMTLFLGDGRERVHSTRDLARLAKLPLPTVSKILKALARAGLLGSHRGVKGGYRLARDPAEISVEEIIRALEGPIAITECVEAGSDCEIEGSCPVRTNWQRINDSVRDALAAIRLSEMASGVSFGGPPGRNGRPVAAPREIEAS